MKFRNVLLVVAALLVALVAGCGGNVKLIHHHVYPRFGTLSVDMRSGLVSVRFYGSTNPRITDYNAWFFIPSDPGNPRDIWFSNSQVYATGNGDRDENEQIFQFLPEFDLPWDWNGSTPIIGSIPAYFQIRIEDDRGDAAIGSWEVANGVVTPINPGRSKASFSWRHVIDGKIDGTRK